MKSTFHVTKKILTLLNLRVANDMFIKDFFDEVGESSTVKKNIKFLEQINFIEIDITFIRLTKEGKLFINDINRFSDSEIDKAIETLSVHYLTGKLDKLFAKILEM